jgi:putative iron-only hydrogenase system regulator
MEDTGIYLYSVSITASSKMQFFYVLEEINMETRVAIIGIIVQDENSVELLNTVLHEYGKYIIGRMGIPYRAKGINIISIAIDAPQDVISALSGKIGKLQGINTKTAYSNVITKV